MVSRRILGAAVGMGALFSGASLLGNILIGLPLPLLMAATGVVVITGVALVAWRATPAQRRHAARTAAVGVGAGIAATVVYDAVKFGLSQLDPSPYNPFEATRVFGELLIGTDGSLGAKLVVGASFHFLNGTMFGLAYTSLFARAHRGLVYALLTGMGWGLFLESFQYALYPDWLGISFVDEFVRISALSHLAYGAALGLLARAMLRGRALASWDRREAL